MSNRLLSMWFYERPEYARQTLAALQRCENVENYTLVACVDPGNNEIRALVEEIDSLDCRRRFNPIPTRSEPEYPPVLPRSEIYDWVEHPYNRQGGGARTARSLRLELRKNRVGGGKLKTLFTHPLLGGDVQEGCRPFCMSGSRGTG